MEKTLIIKRLQDTIDMLRNLKEEALENFHGLPNKIINTLFYGCEDMVIGLRRNPYAILEEVIKRFEIVLKFIKLEEDYV